MKKRITKAVFPVGGLGTRFLPATKAMPKEMLPVASKPLIQYAFEEAMAAGIEHFIFVMGRNKNIISNHFDHSYELQSFLDERAKAEELDLVKNWLPTAGHIAYIRQQEPLGLGHAVWCARHFIQDEPFAILLADEMLLGKPGCMKQMVEAYAETQANIIAVSEVPASETYRYGIIAPRGEANGSLIPIQDMVEKPKPEQAPSRLSITGRYILDAKIFNFLEGAAKGAGGEIQLTDAMRRMLQEQPFYAVKAAGKRYDCGTQLGFLEANIAYSLEQPALKAEVEAMLKRLAEEL
jgi:UTP--glucose-1-phosphate uridylyltransferase